MTLIAWLLVLPVATLTMVFAVEVLVGLAPARSRPNPADAARLPTTVIVMPAHDEAAGIATTIARLRPALETFRLLVVADNCSDATAALALDAGAEVIERHDPDRRGKGFALAYARDHLVASPPEAVIVLDADCAMDAASLRAVAVAAVEWNRPAQAINLLSPDLSASAMVQVSTFAFMIKNLVRQRGLERLARRVHLTGTGMAFPWSVFAAARLATSDIVEDLGLGLDLAAEGRGALLVPQATVWSPAAAAGSTLSQRGRWEGGFLATSLRRALPDLWRALARARPHDAWAALSLLVPPLALLVLLDGFVCALVLALVVAGASPSALWLLVLALAAAGIVLVAAWQRHGRKYLAPSAAIRAPLYLLWKVPLYLRLLRGQPAAWKRADRD